jgi:uncharacterized membrane protein YcfT
LTRRMDWIDFAKGVSIFLVTLYHATLFLNAGEYHVVQIMKFNEIISTVRMPLFFTISGLMASTAVRDKWKNLIRTKIIYLIWLLSIWSVIRILWSHLVLARCLVPAFDGAD